MSHPEYSFPSLSHHLVVLAFALAHTRAPHCAPAPTPPQEQRTWWTVAWYIVFALFGVLVVAVFVKGIVDSDDVDVSLNITLSCQIIVGLGTGLQAVCSEQSAAGTCSQCLPSTGTATIPVKDPHKVHFFD